MKLIDYIINKFKKKKMNTYKYKIGDKVKLKETPKCKLSSGNGYLNKGGYFTIQSYHNQRGIHAGGGTTFISEKGTLGYYVNNEYGTSCGYVYEYEIGEETKEEILEQLESLQSDIDCLKSKLEWMDEVGVCEYDEDEFKVYGTLKTLQDDDLSLKDKTKLIASLIKGDNC